MLCPKCGYYADHDENVCPACGEILNHESGFREHGAQAIRQGKRAREAAKSRPEPKAEKTENHRRRSGASHATVEMPRVSDSRSSETDPFEAYRISEEDNSEEPGPVFERRRRTVYTDEADDEQARQYLAGLRTGKRRSRSMVNWMKITIVSISALTALIVISLLILNLTDWGERLQVRLSQRFPNLKINVHSASLWAVGDELMDEGQVLEAIQCFEQAKAKDEEEGTVDVDGLLMLGNAYEAAGQTENAADLYESIYTETPSRTEAYIAHIRILQNSENEDDLVKASELMRTAYENTGAETFLTQRSDLLPASPEAKPVFAYYETKRTITLTSYQGYDIYYTEDEKAVFPDGWIKYDEPFPLDEGVHTLRAVAVNGNLVSDELKGTYKIIMPSPQAPQCNLAPKTYKTKQQVRLKPGKDNINDDDIIIYYTVDGSEPNSDSPIYDGTPVRLANGRVTLKAVAVNHYGKVSNPLEVNYKIEANPKPKSAFGVEDTLDKILPGTTTQLEFFEAYGEGESAGTVQSGDYSTECRRYDYPWGYVIMNLPRKTWVVVEVCYTSDDAPFSAPRGTGIGQTETAVVDKYKDMLQLESASHNRGLYYVEEQSGKIYHGKIYQMEDGTRTIRYRYYDTAHWLQLEYRLNKSGTVNCIDMKYIP